MDETALKVAITRAGVTNRFLARNLGISEQAFYNKISGESEFKSSEIRKLSGLLNLSFNDINDIFFSGCVN